MAMDEHEQFWLITALLREQVYQHMGADLMNAMRAVQPGKIVCEISLRDGDPRNSIGLLLEIGRQPLPDWDEAEEEEPNPGESYWLIRTLDGRDFRWTNAMFVVVPEPDPQYPLSALYAAARALWAKESADEPPSA